MPSISFFAHTLRQTVIIHPKCPKFKCIQFNLAIHIPPIRFMVDSDSVTSEEKHIAKEA